LVFAAVVCVLTQAASACPTCKNGLMEGDEASQRLLRGYFWSILFMMSMPFAILIGVGGYMYREVKKAQAKSAAEAEMAGEILPGAP
jgi:hypothetical protein